MRRQDLLNDAAKNYRKEMDNAFPKRKYRMFDRVMALQNIIKYYNKDKKADDKIIWAEPLIDSYMSINEMVNAMTEEGYKEEDIRVIINQFGTSISAYDSASVYSIIKSKLS